LWAIFKSMSYFETLKSEPSKIHHLSFQGRILKETSWRFGMVYNAQGDIDGLWIKPWLNSMQ